MFLPQPCRGHVRRSRCTQHRSPPQASAQRLRRPFPPLFLPEGTPQPAQLNPSLLLLLGLPQPGNAGQAAERQPSFRHATPPAAPSKRQAAPSAPQPCQLCRPTTHTRSHRLRRHFPHAPPGPSPAPRPRLGIAVLLLGAAPAAAGARSWRGASLGTAVASPAVPGQQRRLGTFRR